MKELIEAYKYNLFSFKEVIEKSLVDYIYNHVNEWDKEYTDEEILEKADSFSSICIDKMAKDCANLAQISFDTMREFMANNDKIINISIEKPKYERLNLRHIPSEFFEGKKVDIDYSQIKEEDLIDSLDLTIDEFAVLLDWGATIYYKMILESDIYFREGYIQILLKQKDEYLKKLLFDIETGSYNELEKRTKIRVIKYLISENLHINKKDEDEKKYEQFENLFYNINDIGLADDLLKELLIIDKEGNYILTQRKKGKLLAVVNVLVDNKIIFQPPYSPNPNIINKAFDFLCIKLGIESTNIKNESAVYNEAYEECKNYIMYKERITNKR